MIGRGIDCFDSVYPATVGTAENEQITSPVGMNRDTEEGMFVGSSAGKLYSLNNDGSAKWTVPFETTGAISSAPQVTMENGNTFIYIANDAGYIYKIKDQGTSGTTTGGWTINLGAVVKAEPIMTGGSIYIGAANGKLFKIDDATGSVIWDTSTAISGNLTGSAAVDEFTPGVSSCWIGSEGGSLYRVNTVNGQVLSTLTTGSSIKSSPFIDGGYQFGASNNLFIPSTDGKMYCRSSVNLTLIPDGWKNRGGQEDGNYNIGSAIETVPFYWAWESPKALYFGANNGKMYKINGETGTPIWEFTTAGAIKSSPIVYNGWVYFGSDDGRCYCISASDGILRSGWPVTTGAAVKAMPVLGGWDDGFGEYTNITFTSTDGKVYALQIQ